MADDERIPQQATAASHDHVPTTESTQHSNTNDLDQNRGELVARARAFLTSPQVAHEDVHSKRAFLVSKGLAAPAIERLLAEMPPLVPPRTYPVPPPSNLPYMLMGIARLFSWIAGGSVLLVLAYMRYILPRLTRSLHARQALKTHQSGLLNRLHTSLEELRAEQATSVALLPRPPPAAVREDKQWAGCHSLDDIMLVSGTEDATRQIPKVSALRCAVEELAAKENRPPFTAEVLSVLRERMPWLDTETEPLDETSLETALSALPIFTSTVKGDARQWAYTGPVAIDLSAQLASLTSLSASIPRTRTDASPRQTQHLLQAFTGFTAFLTSHAYGLASGGTRALFSGDVRLTPEAEEVRREIRALKGLVLNRRSFMGGPPAAQTATSATSVS